MALALYRKYRPQKLSEVIGQERVTKTLEQALMLGRLGHAYIFSGPRGTGKTSVARILARAANCEKNKDGILKEGEPCNSCAACKRAISGQELDLIEIDAASNRGIDEIRELREKVRFAPGKTAKKVFLIDEFHMLTKEAFNALLKTLEEPPEHAIFILATTEIHNVPATVLSRAQHFTFKTLVLDDLAQLIKSIASKEKIEIKPDAINLLASQAEGGARDALGLLELLRTATPNKEIDDESVRQILALPDTSQLCAWTTALVEQDQKKAISTLNNIAEQGTDVTQFAKSLVLYLRAILLFSVNEELGGKVTAHLTSEQVDEIKLFSKNLPKKTLLQAVASVNQAANEVKTSQVSILPLEIATLSLIPETNSRINDTNDHEDGAMGSQPKIEKVLKSSTKRSQSTSKPTQKASSSLKSDNLEPVDPKMLGQLVERWTEAVDFIRTKNMNLASLLNSAVVLKIAGGVAQVVVEYEFYRERLMSSTNRDIVETSLQKLLGRKILLNCNTVSELSEEEKKEYEVQKNRKISAVDEKEDSSKEPLTDLAVDLLGGQVVD